MLFIEYGIIIFMSKALILNTVLEESADYSQLINNLTGGYVAQDVTVDSNGEELETPIEHPHKDLEVPNFSGDVHFAHFVDSYTEAPGVSHTKFETLSTSKAWNHFFNYAKDNDYTHLVVLNGVTNINPHIISLAIDANGDKDVINISDGGAFIVNCSSDFNANEDYNIWFADNEILDWANNNNSYARNNGNFVELSQVNTTSALVDAAIAADLATKGM
jgi:hypothetical protein